MREAAARLARPNAAEEIIDHCIARLTGPLPEIATHREVDSCNGN
jgi:hypothetical protein